MKLDTLGAISNAHLALADQLGPEHPDLLELCNLHSTAVDCELRVLVLNTTAESFYPWSQSPKVGAFFSFRHS